jgi:hypothetical protein
MPPKDRGDTTAARPTTRKRAGSLTTPDEYQDIKNVQDGRRFLERFSLLCPPGEPTSIESVSICLHQISALAGLPKQAINAIRAAAFLLEELEENSVNETVRSAFDSQITEFTSDMKMLVNDVNTKIDAHLNDALEQITKATAGIKAPQTTHAPQIASNATPTYASALINPPPHVNPRLAAREGIKARQFQLIGIRETEYGHYDTQQLKAELNKKARELGLKEGKIRSVIAQKDGNLIIEVDSDISAKWYANTSNKVNLCVALGDNVSFRPKLFNVLAFNVPLTIDVSDPKHVDEINEANDLEDYAVSSIRWAKPSNRRAPQQKSAHLILSFLSPEAANRVISNGIWICNKKCHVERIKREPIRCLKCQGWNHMAKDCSETEDRCSNCAGAHRTAACLSPRAKRCVSCKSDGHASWSRECPTFLKKAVEFNERNPENMLPFFPTADPWTWSAGHTNVTNQNNSTSKLSTQKFDSKADSRQNPDSNHEPNRPWDTYFPSYGGSQDPPNRGTQAQAQPPDDGWWDDQIQKATNNPTRSPQPNGTGANNTTSRYTFINNNGGNGGPSNTNIVTNA